MINLAVENITLSYNHHPVVEDFSFTLQPGEIVGLIGPNGCGKTSIIKAVSRILGLKSGTIKLNGEDIYLYPRSNFARILGVVPQNPFIPDTFTVFEVVLLGRNPHLGMFRTESTHDMAVVWKAMKQTGVDALAARRMGELSGGEKQRVTIARVLAQEPSAILLDEPTANLDISHQMEILKLIRKLCRRNNLLVMVAIHDLNMAAQYCDRLILVKGGRVYSQGTPWEVITEQNIREVYGAASTVYPHPENKRPVVLVNTEDHDNIED
jgi:iron complex transport system ATP-binding protein